MQTGSYLPVEDDEDDLETLAQSAPLGTKQAENRAAEAKTEPKAEPRTGPATGAASTADPVEAAEIANDRTGTGAAAVKAVPVQVHSSAELMEKLQGRTNDAPMCYTCGTKMRPAGSCYVCEGCGSS